MQQVATPVMQGNSPHLFLDQAAYFEMNPETITQMEKEILMAEAVFRAKKEDEKRYYQSLAVQQAAQQAAFRQALSSPQAQAMIGNQVGMV